MSGAAVIHTMGSLRVNEKLSSNIDLITSRLGTNLGSVIDRTNYRILCEYSVGPRF